MKKLLALIGLVGFVGVALTVALLATCVRRGQALDESSRAYVDEVVPRICANWDRQALLAEVSPELIETVDAARNLERLVEWFAQSLGPMSEYEGSKGQALAMFQTKRMATDVTARYRARVRFEKGEAEISLLLVRRDERWKISGFHVNSDLLIPGVPAAGAAGSKTMPPAETKIASD